MERDILRINLKLAMVKIQRIDQSKKFKTRVIFSQGISLPNFSFEGPLKGLPD
jgi:hypothetical protein